MVVVTGAGEFKSTEHRDLHPTPFFSLQWNFFLSLQNLTMYRIPTEKVCLLGPLSDNQKPPNVLIEELEKVGTALSWIITCAAEIGWS